MVQWSDLDEGSPPPSPQPCNKHRLTPICPCCSSTGRQPTPSPPPPPSYPLLCLLPLTPNLTRKVLDRCASTTSNCRHTPAPEQERESQERESEWVREQEGESQECESERVRSIACTEQQQRLQAPRRTERTT